jgi:hypothetical protein
MFGLAAAFTDGSKAGAYSLLLLGAILPNVHNEIHNVTRGLTIKGSSNER